jgi:hypothetical protein
MPNPKLKSVGGRPRALDEMKCREICALISAGCGMTDAARYVGCAVCTIRREALRNPQFSDALQRAYLAAELSPLHDIRAAGKKYWRAAAWLLERTNPQRFAKQNVNFVKPEQLSEFVRVIAEIVGQEVPLPSAQQRILRRLNDFDEQMQRETWLAHRDPCPPPRRARKVNRQADVRPRLAAPDHVSKPADEQLKPANEQ